MSDKNKTLLFNRSSFESLLGMEDYIQAVEYAHKMHAQGNVIQTDLVHADAPKGEYHIKTGGILGENAYYGLKANGGFFNNQSAYGLPNILGIIYLSNAENAYPVAIFESSLITKMRTAAATAVAAKHLAPKGPVHLGVIGSGNQAEAHIRGLSCVCNIKSIRISGRNHNKSQLFAERITHELNTQATAGSIEDTCKNANIIVTCTPSTSFLVHKEWVNPGTFIAAVGADSPGKNELDPELFVNARIVGDITAQIITVGESQHPIGKGIISEKSIHGELGELVQGSIDGRMSKNEITIYDSTGTAIQDIACAAYIYEKLKDKKDIMQIDLFN